MAPSPPHASSVRSTPDAHQGDSPPDSDEHSEASITERCRRYARGMASDLLHAAETKADGSLTWGRGYGRDEQFVEDAGPFCARSGEAIFFAALHAQTGTDRFREAAQQALVPAIRTIEKGEADALADAGGLGNIGFGGLLYALARTARFLDDDRMAAAAYTGIDGITDEEIERDDVFDVHWGTGGALLALCFLAEEGDGAMRERALERAHQCARHLLDHRVKDDPTGLKAWATIRDMPWTGYAHGSTGIADGLLRLHGLTSRTSYYDAAIEAFSFERALYDEAQSNWPDARDAHMGDSVWMSSWCHGATGIGLGRLSALRYVSGDDEKDVANDLMRALDRTIANPVQGADNLCCGNLGRVDFLLGAGRALGNETLLEAAHNKCEAVLDRADHRGALCIPDRQPPADHLLPGFWQGRAGIGYMLLRMTAPSSVPSVLIYR